MSQDKKVGASANTTSSPASSFSPDNKVHYDEVTAFSDPIPKDRDLTSNLSDSDEDGLALEKNPFLDPDVAEHWSLVYEKSQYECRSAFDPTYTWTADEEKAVVWKLEKHVCFWAVSQALYILPILRLTYLKVCYVLRTSGRQRQLGTSCR